MNSNRDNLSNSQADKPRASVDAMISEAMDLELAGDHARAAAVWRLIDEKYPAERATVRTLREGMSDLRRTTPPHKDFTSAVMVRMASEDDLDALDVTARAELEASAQAVVDDAPRMHAPAKAGSLRRFVRPRISATTVAFLLGMCATAALVVIAAKYHKPEARSLVGEMAVQRAMQMPETPAVTETAPVARLRLGDGTRYERAWEQRGSQLAIMGGSGAIHAHVPIGLAPLASPVRYASADGVAMRGATVVFDPLWRMREQGRGTGVLQSIERSAVPIGNVDGSRIQLDSAGMLVLPVR
jgi:hypothetical protein